MQLNQEMMRVICELESVVGNECYNPNSYNGYTGEAGKLFRYPVWSKSEFYNGYEKHEYGLGLIAPDDLQTIHYRFGSNHLRIGLALKKTLEFLEQRYDIDFNELESKFKEQNRAET